jgi:hypothetical protein
MAIERAECGEREVVTSEQKECRQGLKLRTEVSER